MPFFAGKHTAIAQETRRIRHRFIRKKTHEPKAMRQSDAKIPDWASDTKSSPATII